jgi:dienelactone hydrolase
MSYEQAPRMVTARHTFSRRRHPAVIFYMDGLGIRPTIFEMGQRLAGHGYVVLAPDLYYRAGHYEPLDPKEIFASGDVRAADCGGNLSRPYRCGGQLPRWQPSHRLRAQPAPACACDRRPGLCRRG